MSRSREKRKRAKIRKDDIIASLIGDHLLTRQERDRLRAAKVPSEEVIRLTTPDHVALHALDGEDDWWNLTIKLRGPELKAKDNQDTSIVAKSDRVVEGEREHLAALARKLIGSGPSFVRDERPRARIPSRGFPKGHRPLRSGNLQRRQPCK